MKKSTIFSVGTMLAIGVAGAAHSQFDGPYDPGSWSFSGGAGNGSFTNDGTTLVLTGSELGFTVPADTDYTIMAAGTGNWTFNWNYSSIDYGTFDSGGYLLNGSYVELADNDSPGSGSVSVGVNFGDTIGYRVFSADSIFGAGVLTIDRFDAPVPGPAAAALLGVAGLLGRRSRHRR